MTISDDGSSDCPCRVPHYQEEGDQTDVMMCGASFKGIQTFCQGII